MKNSLTLRALINLYPYFPQFLTDLCVSQYERSPQIKSSNNSEFCENWGNESHALFKGVVNKCGWNSVQEICTQCCWAHGSFIKSGSGKIVLLLEA